MGRSKSWLQKRSVSLSRVLIIETAVSRGETGDWSKTVLVEPGQRGVQRVTVTNSNDVSYLVVGTCSSDSPQLRYENTASDRVDFNLGTLRKLNPGSEADYKRRTIPFTHLDDSTSCPLVPHTLEVVIQQRLSERNPFGWGPSDSARVNCQK